MFSRFTHVGTCPHFIVLNGWTISHRVDIPLGLSVHQLTDPCVASLLRLLWIVLLWMLVSKLWSEHLISVPVVINPGWDLLGHMVISCLIYGGTINWKTAVFKHYSVVTLEIRFLPLPGFCCYCLLSVAVGCTCSHNEFCKECVICYMRTQKSLFPWLDVRY